MLCSDLYIIVAVSNLNHFPIVFHPNFRLGVQHPLHPHYSDLVCICATLL